MRKLSEQTLHAAKTNPEAALVCKTCTQAERRGAEPRESFFYYFFFYLPAVDRPECQLRRIDYKCTTKPRHPPLRGRASTQIGAKSPAQVEVFFFFFSSVVIVTVVICGVHTLSPKPSTRLFFLVAFGERRHAECCGCASERGRV